ncbi:crt1 [Dorcoceras hygrometricum]|uniref:Crt1 n=1 Tax=Dorcoceras hygrometricum TaxID=472368 RepID=A0A2Z7DB09_9LAMI|nr:crt1 [Dorcoceras hygrometricum]
MLKLNLLPRPAPKSLPTPSSRYPTITGCFYSSSGVDFGDSRRRGVKLALSPVFGSTQLNLAFGNGKPVVTVDSDRSWAACRAVPGGGDGAELSASDKKAGVIVWSAITLMLAVVNRVLHKLALVPMKEYPLFLAQINTFVFVAVYFPLLYLRYKGGLVTDEMLSIPKAPFIAMGFLESVSLVSGMYAGAMLPGPVIPLLYQTFLIWQLVFFQNPLEEDLSLEPNCWVLSRSCGSHSCAYKILTYFSCHSGSSKGPILAGMGILWPALMVLSSAFQAGASIVKESVFIDAATRLKGKLLDVFVVNCFGSATQAAFVLLCLPILLNLKGITMSQLPMYFKSGAACFLNIGGNMTGCAGAPMLPLLFIISSVLFNISVLNLLKFSDAIVASLAVRASVPIAIYALSLPLPYLPQVESLSPFFHLGSMILVVGLILYNMPRPQKQLSKAL